MEETHVVTCFLRNGADVLLCRRSDDVESYSGRWGAVAGHAEGDPEAAAREEIEEETGFDPAADVQHVRSGESFPVADRELGTRWIVHPFLFDASRRDVEPNHETADWEWVSPIEIRRRETVPGLWTSYDSVRPRVETIATDTEHGSAHLSLRALEVLRDEAARIDADNSWDAMRTVARDLLTARSSMPVVANRVNRAMHEAAGERTAAAVERAAESTIEAALGADAAAAAAGAARVSGDRVATLSRSGTVAEAIDRGDPEAVLVAESRPGGEGRGVARSFAAAGHDVTLTSDAALAFELDAWDADAVLVGADAIFPDGRLRNKVGTRGLAAAAAHEGIGVLMVAATDKIQADSPGADDIDLEPRPSDELLGDSDGTDSVSPSPAVANPTFDVTPAELLDVVLTEDGPCAPEDLERIAAVHRRRAGWQRTER